MMSFNTESGYRDLETGKFFLPFSEERLSCSKCFRDYSLTFPDGSIVGVQVNNQSELQSTRLLIDEVKYLRFLSPDQRKKVLKQTFAKLAEATTNFVHDASLNVVIIDDDGWGLVANVGDCQAAIISSSGETYQRLNIQQELKPTPTINDFTVKENDIVLVASHGLGLETNPLSSNAIFQLRKPTTLEYEIINSLKVAVKKNVVENIAVVANKISARSNGCKTTMLLVADGHGAWNIAQILKENVIPCLEHFSMLELGLKAQLELEIKSVNYDTQAFDAEKYSGLHISKKKLLALKPEKWKQVVVNSNAAGLDNIINLQTTFDLLQRYLKITNKSDFKIPLNELSKIIFFQDEVNVSRRFLDNDKEMPNNNSFEKKSLHEELIYINSYLFTFLPLIFNAIFASKSFNELNAEFWIIFWRFPATVFQKAYKSPITITEAFNKALLFLQNTTYQLGINISKQIWDDVIVRLENVNTNVLGVKLDSDERETILKNISERLLQDNPELYKELLSNRITRLQNTFNLLTWNLRELEFKTLLEELSKVIAYYDGIETSLQYLEATIKICVSREKLSLKQELLEQSKYLIKLLTPTFKASVASRSYTEISNLNRVPKEGITLSEEFKSLLKRLWRFLAILLRKEVNICVSKTTDVIIAAFNEVLPVLQDVMCQLDISFSKKIWYELIAHLQAVIAFVLGNSFKDVDHKKILNNMSLWLSKNNPKLYKETLNDKLLGLQNLERDLKTGNKLEFKILLEKLSKIITFQEELELIHQCFEATGQTYDNFENSLEKKLVDTNNELIKLWRPIFIDNLRHKSYTEISNDIRATKQEIQQNNEIESLLNIFWDYFAMLLRNEFKVHVSKTVDEKIAVFDKFLNFLQTTTSQLRSNVPKKIWSELIVRLGNLNVDVFGINFERIERQIILKNIFERSKNTLEFHNELSPLINTASSNTTIAPNLMSTSNSMLSLPPVSEASFGSSGSLIPNNLNFRQGHH